MSMTRRDAQEITGCHPVMREWDVCCNYSDIDLESGEIYQLPKAKLFVKHKVGQEERTLNAPSITDCITEEDVKLE